MAFGLELLIHLRAKPVHQHHFHAHALNHGQVLHQAGQFAGFYRLACDGDHKGFATVHVYVGGDRAEPGDEGEIENSRHGLAAHEVKVFGGQDFFEITVKCVQYFTQLQSGCGDPNISG